MKARATLPEPVTVCPPQITQVTADDKNLQEYLQQLKEKIEFENRDVEDVVDLKNTNLTKAEYAPPLTPRLPLDPRVGLVSHPSPANVATGAKLTHPPSLLLSLLLACREPT